MAKRRPNREPKRLWQPWTEEELELIMTSNKPDKELAKKLGRSVSAIHNKRHTIYNQELKEARGEN